MTRSGGGAAGRTALLQTKLYAPRWRPGLVSRPRLVDRLRAGAGRKLTLLSAPAGFGKTTLLAEWLHNPGQRDATGWVSLDPGDNDPVRFWSHVIAALQRVRPGVGEQAAELLHAHEPPPIETILATLINELHESGGEAVLVLDDVHVIETPAIVQGVTFLLEHLPPGLRLTIASRSDPALPLARLRGRGESVEIRQAELRFTEAEAAAFLNEAMGLALTAEDVAGLERRTEGWIAGLHLAALSMQGRADAPAFVRAFAGDDRYIVDYLVEEVLRRLPPDLRDFLPRTAVLERLSGPLCDALTGRDDGKATLEALERQNLFVVALDDKRQWYRYHHLFAEVLRVQLAAERPGLEADLRQRAAAWLEAQGMIPEAIEQAVAAGDHQTVARLVVAHVESFERMGHSASLARWCAALPEELVRRQPRLALIKAAIAVELDPNLDEARTLLGWVEDAIARLERDPGADASALGPGGMAALRADALVLRISSRRDLPRDEMRRSALLALELLPAGKHHARGTLYQLLAGLHTDAGEWDAALGLFERAVAEARLAGSTSLLACALTGLGDVQVATARLEAGRRTVTEAVAAGQLASAESAWALSRSHAFLAEVLLEQDDLDGAVWHANQAIASVDQGPARSFQLHSRTIAARVFLAAGDPAAARAQLDAARTFAAGARRFRYPSLLAAAELKILGGLGDLAAAAAVVERRGLTPGTPADEENAEELTAYARLLLLRGDIRGAAAVLERVMPVARRTGRVHHEIRALAPLALARERLGRRQAALETLGLATALAEPGRFRRTFTAEAPELAMLLRALAGEVRRGAGPARAGSLGYLDALASAAAAGPRGSAPAALPERLTEREAEILRLIVAGMKNQEIADHLYISLPTVKRHIANAYGKLGVSYRTEAVARAAELGLR